MLGLNPHLHFCGQCAEAFRFYKSVLSGERLFLMTYGESPMADEVPSDWRDKVIHASLELGDQSLTGADVPADRYQKPQGMAVLLALPETSDAERIFKELAEDGMVQLSLQETFWAKRFGMVTDRFGTPWMLNCSAPG